MQNISPQINHVNKHLHRDYIIYFTTYPHQVNTGLEQNIGMTGSPYERLRA